MPLHYVMNIVVKIFPVGGGKHQADIEMTNEDEDDICVLGSSVNDATAAALRELAERLAGK